MALKSHRMALYPPAQFRHMRESLGLSRAQLAEAIGYDIETIRDWERSRHAIPSRIYQQIEARYQQQFLQVA